MNSLSIRKRKLLIAWLFVLPVLLIRGFTTIYPIVTTIKDSLFEIRLLKSPLAKFCGLDNYFRIFTDSKVQITLEFTAIFTVCSVVALVVLGTLFALMLNVRYPGKRFMRTIALIPWAMPTVVIGMAAGWGFDNTYGFINDLIRRVSPGFTLNWLAMKGTARVAVILVDVWKNTPYFAILALAALQFIPYDIYEAARIDGSSAVRSFFHITLPIISRTILTLSMFFTIWRLTSFDIVYAMTSGGPANATSLMANRIMMEAFTNLNVGYAAALAVFLVAIMAVVSGLNGLCIRKIDDGGDV